MIELALELEFACLTSLLGTVKFCLSQFGHVFGAQMDQCPSLGSTDEGSLPQIHTCVWSRDDGLCQLEMPAKRGTDSKGE